MTTTSVFTGIGEDQRISSRVLKPPGGGSSIMFDEEESVKPVKSKPAPQQAPPLKDAPQPDKPQDLPPAPASPQELPPAPAPPQEEAKAETNGMSALNSDKGDAATTTTQSNPSPATNGHHHSPATNGSPAVNGASANGSIGVNGSVSTASTTSMSPFPGGTPKHFNTQTRIFGADQSVVTPKRRLRDHERSSIFNGDEAPTNGTHRSVFRQARMARRDPVTGVGVLCWDLHAPRCAPSKWKASLGSVSSGTPSSATPSTATPQARSPEQTQAQRQRVPPGGFSSRLW